MKSVYMVGICGTAMGNLAIMLKKEGFDVIGSDSSVYPPMSEQLNKNGIKILNGYNKENIKKKPDLAIIGNVIRKDNPEAQEIINSGVTYYSLPEALNVFFLKGKKRIVITGTHGKTTSSFMAAWVLEVLRQNPSFFIAGVPKNFDSMGRNTKSNFFVVEGDEYDTVFYDKVPKFFHYYPDYLIINSIEFDHADIYNNIDEIKNVFRKLVSMMKSDGLIIYNADDSNVVEIIKEAKCRVISFSEKAESDYMYKDIKVKNQKLDFKIKTKNKEESFSLSVPGRHNTMNATSVIALMIELGFDIEIIKKGIFSFKGVKRRQEVYAISGGRTIIDDFAHHPTAVKYTIEAIKEWYEKNPFCVLEPRTATYRTKKLEQETIEALSKTDNVIIAPVHLPERVAEEERFNPERVINALKDKNINANYFKNKDEIVEYLKKNTKEGDVILIMSNGGFNNIYDKLVEALNGSF